MKHFFTLAALISITAYCQAQHQFQITEVPIFRSPEDSIEYANSQSIFQKIVSGQLKNMSGDSVLKLMRMVADRSIIGRKKYYQPTRSFTPFDSLKTLTDLNKVTRLSISNSGIKRLPQEIYRCEKLEYLELVNTSAKRLQKLKKLTHLKSIYILNNKCTKPVKLSKSGSVKTFGMRGENSGSIPESYRKFIQLEKLDLADNNMHRFPKGIGKNTALKELLLGYNNLTLEDGHIEASASLEKLELHRNRIKIIPAAIQGFPNLKKLTLNYNMIEQVSDDIGQLKKLEQLSFYNNRLTGLPKGIFYLSNLREIDLYFNQIERIDQQIGNLTSLEVLYLSNNRIISIPESIGNLVNLTELYLSNNRLSDLPAELYNLSGLKVLRINNNYLSQIPDDILKLSELENLDISSNRITELPAELQGLSHLKILVIVNNPWDAEAKESLRSMVEKLRNRNITVHSD